MDGVWVQFLGSLLAVVLIVLLTWFLGFRTAAKLDSEAEATAQFQLAPGGFEPASLALDRQGASAIARDAQGRIAVLVPHGTHFVVRLLNEGSAITARDGVLQIAGIESLQLDLGESAERWQTPGN
ncbi:hypothetical protein GRF63_12635 [Erythrobacter sp. GH3-10]|uniref:Uncharacterized protein n=1 Tax=Aurantiacibacter rhizosphaerae TaxID=2691582 RepID=A0A844XG88_9SPHN|nr:hypothetical protein [Aurantiacibacter rhizosphaerae]